MQPDRVEKLKQEYTDKFVVVDAARPELARFAGAIGRVRTVNFNGRALVEFVRHENHGWYDIALDYLKVVEPPEPDPPKKKPPAKPQAAEKPADQVRLSPLELARMAKEAESKAPAAE